MFNQPPKIFWQRQMDRMCGVHCINAVLQGPFYNEVTLAQIALQLDAKEKQLMESEGHTAELARYLKEGSGNVAEDGNYSIQVLSQALGRLGGLTITSIEAIKDKSKLPEEQGFICNSSSHWFTIRKIGGVWYNLNSTNKKMPEIVSQFYLSAFLMSIKQGGYQIFVVRGALPQSKPSDFDHMNKNQMWIPASAIKSYNDNVLKKKKNFKLNIGGSDEVQYERAIRRSMGQVSSEEQQDDPTIYEQKKEQKKFEAYKGGGVTIEDKVEANYSKFDIDPDADIQLYSTVLLSMQHALVEQPKEGIDVFFRMQSGSKISRKFSPNDEIELLYDFVFLELSKEKWRRKVKFYLSQQFSKQKLLDVTLPISILQQDERLQLNVNEM